MKKSLLGMLIFCTLMESYDVRAQIPRAAYLTKDWMAIRNTLFARARDLSEIHVALAACDDLRKYGESCDRQMKSKEIPDSCFRLLSIEKAQDLIAQEGFEKSKKRLERVCIKRVGEIRSQASLVRVAEELKSEGPRCYLKIREHIDKLEYAFERP